VFIAAVIVTLVNTGFFGILRRMREVCVRLLVDVVPGKQRGDAGE